jgi:hypothetical protein
MKQQVTVRLEPDAYQAACKRARQEHVSLSSVVAAAASEVLLDTADGRDQRLLLAIERAGNRVQKFGKRQQQDMELLQELMALFVRAYFNHTPPIPREAQEGALLSAKKRYHKFLDTLAHNLQSGRSMLGELASQNGEPATNEIAPTSDSASEQRARAPDVSEDQQPVVSGVEQPPLHDSQLF